MIYFQLLLLCLLMFFIALFPPLDIALSLSLPSTFLFLLPLSFFYSRLLFLSFAPWDLVPAGLTFPTMKQMLILIILLAEISL